MLQLAMLSQREHMLNVKEGHDRSCMQAVDRHSVGVQALCYAAMVMPCMNDAAYVRQTLQYMRHWEMGYESIQAPNKHVPAMLA